MASVWAELKRRNVVKVAVAYAIVGWILIEISATVFPILKLPEWTVTFVTMLVLLGLPAALVLSWAYELTPDGLKPAHEVDPSDSITHVTGRKLDFLIIGVLLLAVGFLVFNYVLVDEPDVVVEAPEAPAVEEAQPEPESIVAEEKHRELLPNSVAVLPFESLSPDPDNAFFAAGIHDELLNQLAKISDLNVIARTSVLRYANDPPPITEIADELNVETVMEGTVRYAGGQIRITTQLIDGGTNTHLWSETYDRAFDVDEIFAIESDIAMRIADALEAEFSLAEEESIQTPLTQSPEALALYYKAIHRRGNIGNAAAPDIANRIADFHRYLDEAILIDPEFARAYAMKAIDYASVLLFGAFRFPDEDTLNDHVKQIEEYANQALALEPDLGLAHNALGLMYHFTWRGREAENAYERALRLSPRDRDILIDYSVFYTHSGQAEKSIRLAERLSSVDPQFGLAMIARGYFYSDDLDKAAEVSKAWVELAPNPIGYSFLTQIELARGNNDEALKNFLVAESLLPSVEDFPTSLLGDLIYRYAKLGRGEEAFRIFSEFMERAAVEPVPASGWVLGYLATGEEQRALEWLEVVVNKNANDVTEVIAQLKYNRYRDPVLEKPEFARLREQLGFTDL